MTPENFQARREDRVLINSVTLPFLGSRVEDLALFQYLLLDISLHGARILLPRWAIKRELLRKGDQIDFHLPFIFGGESFNKGKVVWSNLDDTVGGQVCGVRIDLRTPLYYPVYVSFEDKSITVDLTDLQTSEDLVQKILKDTILLKKGILIYLKHIKPILARITGYETATLLQLHGMLFEDTQERVLKNIDQLNRFLNNIDVGVCSMHRIQQVFDLEELREVMEPELEVAVWHFAFDQEVMHQYMSAIFSLEKKVFYNYNTLVMLYVHALTKTDPTCSISTSENVQWNIK